MKLRVIDTETCGVAETDLQMVEVAFIDLIENVADTNPAVERWKYGEAWGTLINPQRDIPYEAMGVHHITDAMVRDAPTTETVKHDIMDGSPDYFVSHHAKYDAMVLRANGVDIRSPWLCTYKASVVLWPESPSHKNQVLRYFLGGQIPAWASEVAPHRAPGDIIVTAGIALKILERISVEHWADISAAPVLLPKVHFGEHANKPWNAVPWSYLDWILRKSNGEWDEDILFTARHHYDRLNRERQRRSPV